MITTGKALYWSDGASLIRPTLADEVIKFDEIS